MAQAMAATVNVSANQLFLNGVNGVASIYSLTNGTGNAGTVNVQSSPVHR